MIAVMCFGFLSLQNYPYMGVVPGLSTANSL